MVLIVEPPCAGLSVEEARSPRYSAGMIPARCNFLVNITQYVRKVRLKNIRMTHHFLLAAQSSQGLKNKPLQHLFKSGTVNKLL